MTDVVAYPERRVASLVTSTDNVPQGTLLNVPSAPLSGSPGPAPIVAANTVHWYQDPVFISTVLGALLALEPVVEDALKSQAFNWRSFTLACISALAAWLRNRINTVLK